MPQAGYHGAHCKVLPRVGAAQGHPGADCDQAAPYFGQFSAMGSIVPYLRQRPSSKYVRHLMVLRATGRPRRRLFPARGTCERKETGRRQGSTATGCTRLCCPSLWVSTSRCSTRPCRYA